jgi:hypothetical protein
LIVFTKDSKTYVGETTAFQQMFPGKLVIYMQKTKTRLLCFTLNINKFKMDQQPETLKLLQGNIGKTMENKGITKYFMNRTSNSSTNKNRISKEIVTRMKT